MPSAPSQAGRDDVGAHGMDVERYHARLYAAREQLCTDLLGLGMPREALVLFLLRTEVIQAALTQYSDAHVEAYLSSIESPCPLAPDGRHTLPPA